MGIAKGIIPLGKKFCRGCATLKDASEFGKLAKNSDGLSYRCKACNKRHMQEWAKRNPEKIKRSNAEWYQKWRTRNPVLEREPFITEAGRLCRVCNTRKPDDEFTTDKKGPAGRGWRCKACSREYLKKWNAEHPYRIRHRGFSNDRLRAMWEAQGGKCAICQKSIVIGGNRCHGGGANVDHCHSTGKVRDLLCSHCNTGLGGFRDKPELLQGAILYLKKHAL